MSLCKLSFLIFMALQLCYVTQAQLQLHDKLGISHANKSFELCMAASKNQTGHWITRFLLNKAQTGVTNNWKVDLKHSITDHGAVNTFHLLGVITVPPPRPADYELFPGVGYYKFHHGSKLTFSEAYSVCAKEGGHLAILNSVEEANAIKTIYARHSKAGGPWSFVGFYDPNKNHDFITIFGQPLDNSGYAEWHPGQPENINSKEFCGCILQNGLYADVGCEDKLSFFCEYDLSWGEI